MKYIVHYGYYECDGMKILNSEKQVKEFIEKQSKGRSKHALFFDVYKVKSIEKIKI